jgi:hypothetical protein
MSGTGRNLLLDGRGKFVAHLFNYPHAAFLGNAVPAPDIT